MRPAFLEIDLDAVRSNVQRIQQMIGPRRQVAAIVKANAYGHGLVPVSRACLEAGCTLLCVAILEEAVRLRDGGVTAPVLVLGPPDRGQAEDYVRREIMPTLSDPAHAEMLIDAARAAGTPARVHLKLNSGIGRPRRAHAGRRGPRRTRGWRTADRGGGRVLALADACNPDLTWSEHQLAQFQAMLTVLLDRLGPPRPLVHMANSAAIIRMPGTHFDAVRPGAILYGLNPGFQALN